MAPHQPKIPITDVGSHFNPQSYIRNAEAAFRNNSVKEFLHRWFEDGGSRIGQRRRNSIAMEGQQLSTPRAYKRSPALSNSTWYKGILVSQMAGTADNGGAFDLVIAKMRRGTEPPPHVHSGEDEFFYILSGEMKVYADGEVFQVTAGECMFLPRGKPHAFLITSEEVHNIAVITPGGFFDAINKMNAPAERMEVPADADIVAYANADLTETIKVFVQYGVRLLSPDEIRAEMPQYPL
jgi:mannose-6-phosphate isomerase-like protein (cupin superfamily)